MARVKSGEYLPINIQYFLQSYECCLQITEILDGALNRIWPSMEYQKSKAQNIDEQKEEAIENAIEQAIEIAEQNEPKKVTKKRIKVKKSNIDNQ